MPTWLVLVNGPISRFVAALLVLGLLRLVILTAEERARIDSAKK